MGSKINQCYQGEHTPLQRTLIVSLGQLKKNMSQRAIPVDFVKSVLHNGVGRYVCQLQRITIKFCKSHITSKGVRDFIEHLMDFTRRHPGVVVYLKPRRFKTPMIVGEYL